jgi:hypothetical protein
LCIEFSQFQAQLCTGFLSHGGRLALILPKAFDGMVGSGQLCIEYSQVQAQLQYVLVFSAMTAA